MDPASKIRKFFGRPVESDKETSGKESGQTKSLEKNIVLTASTIFRLRLKASR